MVVDALEVSRFLRPKRISIMYMAVSYLVPIAQIPEGLLYIIIHHLIIPAAQQA